MPYDAVFLDVDGTLLWVDLDVAGYVEDLAPYTLDGGLTVERATRPVWDSMRRHVKENVKHRSEKDLAAFRLRNAETTAWELGIRAPTEVLMRVADRRISFNPYPESEPVLRSLRESGTKLYVVSNWDIQLAGILDELGWIPYFDGIVVSAVLGVEKPEPDIFAEALHQAGADPERVLHVGNDPVTDVQGAREAGIDTVFVARRGDSEDPGATYVIPDLTGLPEILEK